MPAPGGWSFGRRGGTSRGHAAFLNRRERINAEVSLPPYDPIGTTAVLEMLSSKRQGTRLASPVRCLATAGNVEDLKVPQEARRHFRRKKTRSKRLNNGTGKCTVRFFLPPPLSSRFPASSRFFFVRFRADGLFSQLQLPAVFRPGGERIANSSIWRADDEARDKRKLRENAAVDRPSGWKRGWNLYTSTLINSSPPSPSVAFLLAFFPAD